MTRYLMNTLLVPINFDKYSDAVIELERISKDTACSLIKEGVVSAIGHESTAQFISKLCGVNIPAERRTVFFNNGDEGIHLFLKQRLPEGKILSKEEIEKMDFWFIRSRIRSLR